MNDTQPYCKMGFRAHFVLEWVVRSVLSCIGQDSYRDALKCVSTENNKKQLGGVTGLKNPSLNLGSLSSIIKWYKGRCAFEIGKQFPIGFHWQSRFYDHVIRNDETLNKIREYISKNSARWECDRNNNPENIWI